MSTKNNRRNNKNNDRSFVIYKIYIRSILIAIYFLGWDCQWQRLNAFTQRFQMNFSFYLTMFEFHCIEGVLLSVFVLPDIPLDYERVSY